MTELFNEIINKLDEIYYITKSPTIERDVNEIKANISQLKIMFDQTNNIITDLSGENEELLDKIDDQNFEINTLKDENTELINQIKALEDENIGLKSRQINVERREKKKKKRETKYKHEKRHITEFCDEIVDLYTDNNKKVKIIKGKDATIKNKINSIITLNNNAEAYVKMKLLTAKIVSKFKFGKFEIDLVRNTSYSEMNSNDNYWRLKVSNWFDCKNKITSQKEADKFWRGETSLRLKSLPEYESMIEHNGKTHVLITSLEQFIYLLFWLKFHNIRHMINSSEFNEKIKEHIKNYFLNQKFVSFTLVLDKLFSMSFSELNEFLESIESFGATFYEIVNNEGTTQDINYFMVYKLKNSDEYSHEIISNETKTNFGFNFVDINLFINQITEDLITKLNNDDEVVKTIMINKFEHALSNENNEVYINELINENNNEEENISVHDYIERDNYIITDMNNDGDDELKVEIKTDFNYNRNFDMKNKIEFSRNLHISNDTFIIGESRGILRRLHYPETAKISRKPSVRNSDGYFVKNKSHFINGMKEENYNFPNHNYVVKPDSLVVSF